MNFGVKGLFFIFLYSFVVTMNLKNNINPVLIQIKLNNSLNENQTDDKEEHIKELTFLNLIHNNIKNISDATQTEKKKHKFELNLKDNINQIETNYNNNFKKCLIENVLNSNKICNNDELDFNIAIKEKSIEYINQITQPLNKKLNNFLNFDENKYNELYNNEEDKNFYYNLLSNLQSYYQYKDFEENKTELTNLISKINEKNSELILTRNSYAGMLIDKLKYIFEERNEGDDLFLEGKYLIEMYNEKINEYINETNVNFINEKNEKINSLKNEIKKEINIKMDCQVEIEENERCNEINQINKYSNYILNIQNDVYEEMNKILN